MTEFDGYAFGRRVAAAREWSGLVPKQVAEQLGTSEEAVYRMERGERRTPPRRGELRLLAEILKQPEAWLVAGEDPPWASARSDGDGFRTQEERDLDAERHREIMDKLDQNAEMLRVILSRRDGERSPHE